jgi:hypothetical protein
MRAVPENYTWGTSVRTPEKVILRSLVQSKRRGKKFKRIKRETQEYQFLCVLMLIWEMQELSTYYLILEHTFSLLPLSSMIPS